MNAGCDRDDIAVAQNDAANALVHLEREHTRIAATDGLRKREHRAPGAQSGRNSGRSLAPGWARIEWAIAVMARKRIRAERRRAIGLATWSRRGLLVAAAACGRSRRGGAPGLAAGGGGASASG